MAMSVSPEFEPCKGGRLNGLEFPCSTSNAHLMMDRQYLSEYDTVAVGLEYPELSVVQQCRRPNVGNM